MNVPMTGAPGMMGYHAMMQQGMMPQMAPGMYAPPIPPAGFVNLDPDLAPGLATLDLGYPCPPAPYPVVTGVEHYHREAVQPAGPITYVVKKGDSIYKIAKKFGVTMQAIILGNNLRNPDLIYPGQVLYIPGV